jgi:hypothetical protein
MSKLESFVKRNASWSAILCAFISLLSIYCYLFYTGSVSVWIKNTFGSDIIWLFVGFGIWYILKSALLLKDTFLKGAVWILSLFFSIVVLIGHSLTLNGNLDMYLSTIGMALFLLSTIGFTLVFASIVLLLFNFLDNHAIQSENTHSFFSNSKNVFYKVWFAIFCCYFFYFLLLFPGVISYDTIIEINQCLTGEYTNHHPFIHVMLVSSMLELSKLVGGSLVTGMAFYAIFQMFIMSGIVAYSISFLLQKRIHNYVILFLFGYYALLPVNAIYSVTLWKDILFSGICLLLVIQFIKICYEPKLIQSKKFFISLSLLLVLFCTFRHNGFYAVLLFTPILLFINRRFFKFYFLLMFVVVALVQSYTTVLLPALGVKKGSMREALSIPLQQIARTVKYHGHEIELEDKKIIRQVLETDSLALLYQPHISDLVKSTFNEATFKKNPKLYINLWFKLFTKYPKTYVESSIAGCYGYIDPSVNYGGSYSFSTIYDYDYKDYYFNSPYPKSAQIAKQNKFLLLPKYITLHIPILAFLTSIGFMIWIGLLAFIRLRMAGNKRLLLPFYFLACLYLTVLASPVNAEYRYVYGIIISVPILVCIALLDTKKNNDSTSEITEK